jgi:hypothetical protein
MLGQLIKKKSATYILFSTDFSVKGILSWSINEKEGME